MEQPHDARQDAAPPPEPTRRRRRWPWVLLGLMLGAALLLRALLPLVVERGAAWGSRQVLGLPASVENVDFALLDGRIVIEGVRVGSRPDEATPWQAAFAPPAIDPATALLDVDRIETELSWGALRERTLRVVALMIDAPALRLERESDGAIDPLRHAVPAAAPADEPETPDGDAAAPWKLVLDRFALRAPRVQVADATDGEALLELALEEFALTDLVSDRGDVALGGLGIEQPVLRVKRSLVFREAAEPAHEEAPATAPGAPPTAAPTVAEPTPARPSYTVERIDIERAAFSWITEQGPLHVALGLHASGVTAAEGRRFPVSIVLEIEQGRVELAGEVGLLPPAFDGTFAWDDLPFPPLLLAGMPELSSWLRSASSSGELVVAFDAAGPDAGLGLAGRSRVERLAIADPEDREVAIGWTRLDVEIAEVRVPFPAEGEPAGAPRVRLDRVALTEPKILYTMPSPQLDALLGGGAPESEPVSDPAAAAAPPSPAADAEPAPDAPPSPPIDLVVAALSLEDGDVTVLDRTVEPPVRTTIRDLDFSARDVRFPALQALDARLTAVLPEGAKLSVEGDLRAADQGEFHVVLRDLALPVFAPYAASAGATLEQGAASLDTKLRLRGGKIAVENDLLLKRLDVSLRDPASFEQQFGVPIDMALALLRDPAGNIRLRIPLALGEGGAAVDLAGVLASAMRQALVGALSAPLKVVGIGLVGLSAAGARVAGSSDLIPAEPGGVEPSPAATERIDALAALLAERPGLRVVLSGRAGPVDRPALARRLRDGSDGEPSQVGKGGAPGLLARVTGFFGRLRPGRGADDEAPDTEEIAAVPEARLHELAAQRAERVRARLVEAGIDPARVRVGEARADADPGIVIGLDAG